MSNPLVSVIIPVYNVELYIHKCIQSVISQQYSNLEIIAIDDGSLDNSGIICDRYAEKDSRIHVIHKTNEGASEARNVGLRIAKGKYICFLDSDDFYDQSAISNSVKAAEKHKTDVVVWGYSADFLDKSENLRKSLIYSFNWGIYNHDTFSSIKISNAFLDKLGFVWNKLYRLSLLKNNDCFFQKDISLFEDILFNASVLSVSNTIVFLNKPLTHYIQRPRLTLATKFYKNCFELSMMANYANIKLLKAWRLDEEKINTLFKQMIFMAVKGTVRSLCLSQDIKNEDRIAYLRRILDSPEVMNSLETAQVQSIKDQILLLLLNGRYIRTILCIYSVIEFIRRRSGQ